MSGAGEMLRNGCGPSSGRIAGGLARATVLAAAATMPTAAAHAEPPLQYLTSVGPRNDAALLWWLIGVSVVVTVAISILVVAGVLFRRSRSRAEEMRGEPIAPAGGGAEWLYIGVGVTVILLAISVAWTAESLAAMNRPPSPPGLTIEVSGEQWWWDVRYITPATDGIFETANEIHIPVGTPVRFRLTTKDVIHSFWVPALGGKTDTIPNQVNVTWLKADRPGVYRGQCTEYCGAEHAEMGLYVYADAPKDFDKWMAAQATPASPPPPSVADGEMRFRARCGVCHTVRGTLAGGVVGPDLTHLMSRSTIAAGVLTNTVANLSGWIANPQTIKPESHMPNLDLSGPELTSIRDYLLTLK
jgi:cytochrome c oxidase subunit 2